LLLFEARSLLSRLDAVNIPFAFSCTSAHALLSY
jgi:hypothetical protein